MDRKYFYSFTQSERRGFVALVVLLLIMVVLLFVKPFAGANKAVTADFSAFVDSVQGYELHIVADSTEGNDACSDEKKYGKRKLRPFIFDPNTLEKEGWMAMGFSEKQAQAVVNYRKKGGHFDKKEDIKKIFFVGEEEYMQLEDYVWIAPKVAAEMEKTQWLPTKEILEIELNTADTSALQQLYGIGPVFSKRIVKYRNLLGGYCSKEQLMEVYGLSQELYDNVKQHIVVDTTRVHKLNINTADVDELKRHPYLDYYQAKAVVEHRQKIGAFKTINDLRHIVLIDNNTFEKIKPYLSVQ